MTVYKNDRREAPGGSSRAGRPWRLVRAGDGTHTGSGRLQGRRVDPAGFSFAFSGRGEVLTLPFKAMPLGHARKPRGPPLFEPSFKVPRDNAHNQSSGFAAAPGFKGLNACGPLKVHPRRPWVGFWQRLEE